VAQQSACVRHACRDVRREPVEADAEDGHKRIDETMLYVHFAESHMRPLPQEILAAGRGNDDRIGGSSRR
jgi:hypothetical protein